MSDFREKEVPILDYVRFIMKNPLPFRLAHPNRCITALDAGAGGNVFNFIMEYENFTFIEAVKYLADRAGVKLPEQEYSKEARAAADLKTILLEVNKKAAAYYYYQLRQETGKKHWNICRNENYQKKR